MLDPARTALVCSLDARWRRDGPWAMEADDRLVEVARRLMGLGGGVVAVVRAGGPAPGAGPATVPDPVGSLLSDTAVDIVEAPGTSGFYASMLDGVLRASGRSELVMAGWGLEGPVHSTLRAGNDRGYECLLVPDACVATDDRLVRAACSTVRMSGGIFGAVASTAQLLEALASTSDTDRGGTQRSKWTTTEERKRG